MKLIGIIYKNTEITDQQTFQKLPEDLKAFLQEANGIVAYKGGLHIRGCCLEPIWHSLKETWEGKFALWTKYPNLLDIDIPFAQDCMGDQFLLRNNKVLKLYAETGDIDFLNMDFLEFMAEVENDPIHFLDMNPLIQFEINGGFLEPGKILKASPAFCNPEAANGVNISAIAIEECYEYLFNLSKTMRMEGNADEDDVKFFVGG